MKRFEIYEDVGYDRYMIFIYSNNGVLCGVNYHHGIGDFDNDYMESDDELFNIYLERMSGKGNDETKTDVLRAAIEEKQIRYDEFSREMIVEHQANVGIEILTERMCDSLYINHDKITDAQREMINRMRNDLASTWKQIATAQIKWIK